MDRSDYSAAATCLKLDAAGAEASEALREAGIEALVLKGPVLQAWLYPDRLRPYADVDLLVREDQWEEARDIVGRLGYRDPLAGASDVEVSSHAVAMIREDGAVIDLHWRLGGSKAPGLDMWQELRAEADREVIAGHDLLVCGPLGRIVVVVVHAAQHGVSESKPRVDLARLAAHVDVSEIRRAGGLAERLGASEAFAAGLWMNDYLRGALPDMACEPRSPELRARVYGVRHAPGMGILLGITSGPVRTRLRTLARALWPSADLVRLRHGLPAGASAGVLLRARAARWWYQARQVGGALRRFAQLMKRG